MIIDIHEHVIPRRGFVDPKRGETVCTATELVAIMDREGIDKMVALPLSSPETYHFVQSVEEVFEACDQYPERFIKFANVDPRLQGNYTNAYDFVPILEHYMSLGAVGVGEVTANLRWEDPRYHNLLSACDKLGLPFLFHLAIREFNTYGIIVDPQLKNLEKALQKYPNVKFLAHSTAWWSQVGIPKANELESYISGPVQPGGRVPELLRKYPNLHGDLSAGSGCNAITRDPQWGLEFLDEFQDRLLFGLDICIPSNDGCALLHYLKQIVGEGKLDQAVYDKVMGKNAMSLLDIRE